MSDPADIRIPSIDEAADGALAGSKLSALEKLPAEERASILRQIVDSVPDAIIVHDAAGDILFWSQAACDMLGYSAEEMRALPSFGWIGHDAMKGAAGRLESILHSGGLNFESSAKRKDGSLIPTDVSSRSVHTEEGPVLVAVIRDTSERSEAQQRLRFLAFHDPLTGLPNRAAFEERLRVAIADSRRHGDMLGLAYIDLDRFKPVNDEYGHDAGDSVLVTVGQRLVSHVREQDIVSRLGGDEFVVLLPRINSPAEFGVIAERLLTQIRLPIKACGATCTIDASIGFALFDPDSDDARTLVVRADVAMYSAKRDPEHPWLLWDESMGITPPASGRD